MHTVYLFTTRSGSQYRVTAHPDLPTEHGRSRLRLEKETSLGEHTVVVDDLTVLPAWVEVGDTPLFEGIAPGDESGRNYFCRTSPVEYANNTVTTVLD